MWRLSTSNKRRDALPNQLAQLTGRDLLWVLNETVRRKEELYKWIEQVDPPVVLHAVNIATAGRRSRTAAVLLEPDHLDRSTTALLSSDSEELALLDNVLQDPLVVSPAYESEGAQVPVVQFSSNIYFCTEDEDVMSLDVIRIGDKRGHVEVQYATRDGTARHGNKFMHVEGTVMFEDGEHDKTIHIPILKTDEWEGVLEFHVDLKMDDLAKAGAALGKYLSTTTVKIIDSSRFPSDKHNDYIERDRLEDIPMWSFLWEYIKLNILDDFIRCGTIKAVLISVLHNLYFFLKLFLRVFLIDFVLHSDDVDRAEKRKRLLGVIAVTLVPYAALHMLDYHKQSFGIGGKSRSNIQASLMRRFLNLRETARSQLDQGALIVAMTHDVSELVTYGYLTVLQCADSVGKLLLIVIYQIVAPIVFDKERRYFIMAQLVACPLILTVFIILRTKYTKKAEFERKAEHTKLLGFITFIVNHSRIIADYNRRARCVTDCEAHIKAYNAADVRKMQLVLNNAYFCPWVALICVFLYMYVGGMALIDGAEGLSLGMFLANMGIITTIGKSYDSIFAALLDMQACIDSLRHITHVMNQPTDLLERLVAHRRRRDKTRELKKDLSDQHPDSQNVLDMEPILIKDVEFKYTSLYDDAGPIGYSKVNLLGNIELQQGSLAAFVGPRSEGKTTLLRILSGVMLPDNGLCFIPAHLRVLHVTADTQFYHGTLLENLTFGVDEGNPDSSSAHVRRVLERLGVTNRLMHYFEGTQRLRWADVLSQTECQILNLARAFVCNPEVLCIDRPASVFDEVQGQAIMRLLRDFVSNKGVEQNPETATMRRPRTCIFATEKSTGLEDVDQVFRVCNDKGIQELEDREPHTKE